MEFRRTGSSGLVVSVVGLGCNNFGMRIDADASRAVVDAAFDEGITFFDTADIYGGGQSEEFLGQALQGRRDEAVIATKFGAPTGKGPYRSGGSRRYVVGACEASLRRLGTDHVDLYYLHYPDAATPIDETLSALDDLVHQGKARYVASSNFAAWQLVEAELTAGARGTERFVACQVEWNLLQRTVEREVVPACRRYDIGIVPYFPLASGLLTGKYQRGEAFPEGSRLDAMPYFASVATDANFDTIDRLAAVARDAGRGLVDLAMSWLACQAGVCSVLVGATRPEQVKANVGATDWQLSTDELAAVAEALTPAPA
jgi:aryl-alcohol dehydrogenase-like predicted oxidoreductase